MKKIMPLLLIIFPLLLVGCGDKYGHAVLITDHLTLTDKDQNRVSYGHTFLEVNELFGTVKLIHSRELAHENLLLSFNSFIEYEDPTIIGLEVFVDNQVPSPSWQTPQHIGIGSPQSEALAIYGKTNDDLEDNLMDVLFAEHPEDPTKMYEISVEELYSLKPEQTIFRIVLSFENNAVSNIILGNLDSMT